MSYKWNNADSIIFWYEMVQRSWQSASQQCLWKSVFFGFKNNNNNEKRWNSKQCFYYDTQEWTGTCKKLKTCNEALKKHKSGWTIYETLNHLFSKYHQSYFY